MLFDVFGTSNLLALWGVLLIIVGFSILMARTFAWYLKPGVWRTIAGVPISFMAPFYLCSIAELIARLATAPALTWRLLYRDPDEAVAFFAAQGIVNGVLPAFISVVAFLHARLSRRKKPSTRTENSQFGLSLALAWFAFIWILWSIGWHQIDGSYQWNFEWMAIRFTLGFAGFGIMVYQVKNWPDQGLTRIGRRWWGV